MSAYNVWAPLSVWSTRLWTLLAIPMLALCLWVKRPSCAILFTPYFLNLILNVSILYYLPRYTQTLEFSLILGLAMVASLPAHERQAADVRPAHA